MAVINISSNGKVEDGGSTKNERTTLRRGNPVRWNSGGNGPWSVVFTGAATPLLETTGGNPPLPPRVPVPTPRDGSAKGSSRDFVVALNAAFTSYSYVIVPAGHADSLAPFSGPEIIIESGGGLIRGQKKKKGTAKGKGKKKGNRRASAAKRAQKTKTTRKSASARKGTKTVARRGAKKRSAKKR